MKKMKWNEKQKESIEKVIKHYEIIFDDVRRNWDCVLAKDCCPFCGIYRCRHVVIEKCCIVNKEAKYSKCPNVVLGCWCYGKRVHRTFGELAVVRNRLRKEKDPLEIKVLEKEMEEVIRNRIYYWKVQLKREEV